MTARARICKHLAERGPATAQQLRIALAYTQGGIDGPLRRMLARGLVMHAGFGDKLTNEKSPQLWAVTDRGRDLAQIAVVFDLPYLSPCKNRRKRRPIINSVFALGSV